MKTMTCREMGGTCDAKFTGETVEEITSQGKAHVHELAEAGDEEHKERMDKMGKISPEEMKKWEDETKEKFDALPEE